MLVPAATILTAAFVLVALGYLSAYALAGKNEQRRAQLMRAIEAREARVNALCAMVDAERAGLSYAATDASQPLVQVAERTDYVSAEAAAPRASGHSTRAAWLVEGKARIAAVISDYAAAALRPAAAEPASRPANRVGDLH